MNRPTKIVVDVGNSRIKWGLCDPAAVADIASLPPDDAAAWQLQLDLWKLQGPLTWAVSGVHPPRRDRFADWLRHRGDRVDLFFSHTQLPLTVSLPHPDKVGIDRLLDAVAVNARRAAGIPAVIIDAGSAITVDYVDQAGVFGGGAILPGLRLMAKALHDNTALLPTIDMDADIAVPGTSTVAAMKAGIFCAAVGGIREFVERLIVEAKLGDKWEAHASGGDAALLTPHLPFPVRLWPQMTLEGLRLAAWPLETT